MPRGLSAAQRTAAVNAEIDRQWQLTGLEGVVARPDRIDPRIVAADSWGSGLSDCLNDSGVTSFGYDDSRGFSSVNDDGSTTRLDAAAQLVWYSCFAKYPIVDLLSKAQRNYIYDYYETWLVPCLNSKGYRVVDPPTRAEFLVESNNGIGSQVWNPIWSIDSPRTEAGQAVLQRECPMTTPGVEGWSQVSPATT